MRFTYRELRQEAERELNLRLRTYPGKVMRRRLTKQASSRKLALQHSIVEVLRELEKSETFQLCNNSCVGDVT